MGTKTRCAMSILSIMLLIAVALTAVNAAGHCNQTPLPSTPTHPPHVKKPPKHTIPHPRVPVVGPPPVVVYPPPAVVNPPTTPPPAGGVPAATIPPPSTARRCSIDVLKLGLCLDVLGGLVHLGIRPLENVCCPVLQGLLEAEAAVCLCTAIKLRILNLNIYIPLALNVLVTCGKEPPPGYLCPEL